MTSNFSKLALLIGAAAIFIAPVANSGPKIPNPQINAPEFKLVPPTANVVKIDLLKKQGLTATEADFQPPMKVSILNMGKEGEYGINFKNIQYVSSYQKTALVRAYSQNNPNNTGQVEIWFKAKPNKTYMLDCAVIGGTSYIARVGASTTQQTPISNRIYVIVPPRSVNITQIVYLTALATYSYWTFQDCEITQIGN